MKYVVILFLAIGRACAAPAEVTFTVDLPDGTGVKPAVKPVEAAVTTLGNVGSAISGDIGIDKRAANEGDIRLIPFRSVDASAFAENTADVKTRMNRTAFNVDQIKSLLEDNSFAGGSLTNKQREDIGIQIEKLNNPLATLQVENAGNENVDQKVKELKAEIRKLQGAISNNGGGTEAGVGSAGSNTGGLAVVNNIFRTIFSLVSKLFSNVRSTGTLQSIQEILKSILASVIGGGAGIGIGGTGFGVTL